MRRFVADAFFRKVSGIDGHSVHAELDLPLRGCAQRGIHKSKEDECCSKDAIDLRHAKFPNFTFLAPAFCTAPLPSWCVDVKPPEVPLPGALIKTADHMEYPTRVRAG
jgi:hypothetical protein